MPRTIYDSGAEPDPASARDVLAFVLSRPETSTDVDEIAAVGNLLGPAKVEAVRRWFSLQPVN